MKKTISTSVSSNGSLSWGETPRLNSEQIIEWLEGYRSWMIEVWQNNPALRRRWEILHDPSSARKPDP